MTRKRWFCSLCGGLTQRPPDKHGRVLCAGHADLQLDAVPPDPLESLPMQSAVIGEAVEAARERGD